MAYLKFLIQQCTTICMIVMIINLSFSVRFSLSSLFITLDFRGFEPMVNRLWSGTLCPREHSIVVKSPTPLEQHKALIFAKNCN